MKRIWKYPLKLTPMQVIDVPTPCKVLSAQIQNGEICLWIIHEGGDLVQLDIYIVGTGHVVSPEAESHLGTIQQDGFVWHIFW